MPWVIFLILFFAGLHFVLLLPVQMAIAGAAGLVVLLWILWKLKWVILAVIGLEEIFGGRDNNA